MWRRDLDEFLEMLNKIEGEEQCAREKADLRLQKKFDVDKGKKNNVKKKQKKKDNDEASPKGNKKNETNLIEEDLKKQVNDKSSNYQVFSFEEMLVRNKID